MREAAFALIQRCSGKSHESSCESSCRGDGHLLSQHGSECDLGSVDGARDAQTRDPSSVSFQDRVPTQAAGHRLRVCIQIQEAATALIAEVKQGDLILVKGSRGVATDKIVKTIKKQFPLAGEDVAPRS